MKTIKTTIATILAVLTGLSLQSTGNGSILGIIVFIRKPAKKPAGKSRGIKGDPGGGRYLDEVWY